MIIELNKKENNAKAAFNALYNALKSDKFIGKDNQAGQTVWDFYLEFYKEFSVLPFEDKLCFLAFFEKVVEYSKTSMQAEFLLKTKIVIDKEK